MRAAVSMPNKRQIFLEQMRRKRSVVHDAIEEATESDSVDTFTSSSSGEDSKHISKKSSFNKHSRGSRKKIDNSFKKLPKLIPTKSFKSQRSKSFLVEPDIEEEEKENIIKSINSGPFSNKPLSPVKFQREGSLPPLNIARQNFVTPRFPNQLSEMDKIILINEAKEPEFESSERKSSGYESDDSQTEKSSSEFDINKPVHTSQDHSSRLNESSDQINRSSLRRSRQSSQRMEANTKTNDKRKTSASTKENKIL